MVKKIWDYPMHKRRKWRRMSYLAKIFYFMKPIIDEMGRISALPFPFPTDLKILYWAVLSAFVALPILIPTIVGLSSYATVQYVLEEHAGIEFPDNWDILWYYRHLNDTMTDKRINFVELYVERWWGELFISSTEADLFRIIYYYVFNDEFPIPFFH